MPRLVAVLALLLALAAGCGDDGPSGGHQQVGDASERCVQVLEDDGGSEVECEE